jgi:hypothetical protein
MSILNKKEQIRIESVKQLEQVYEVLKEEWDKEYSINDQINSFTIASSVKWYVRYCKSQICMYGNNDHCETITFGQFMSRVNPEPKTETIIIEAKDGKKYEVIVVREVVEPLNFWKWAEQNAKGLTTNENIEDYVQYRFEVGR